VGIAHRSPRLDRMGAGRPRLLKPHHQSERPIGAKLGSFLAPPRILGAERRDDSSGSAPTSSGSARLCRSSAQALLEEPFPSPRGPVRRAAWTLRDAEIVSWDESLEAVRFVCLDQVAGVVVCRRQRRQLLGEVITCAPGSGR